MLLKIFYIKRIIKAICLTVFEKTVKIYLTEKTI